MSSLLTSHRILTACAIDEHHTARATEHSLNTQLNYTRLAMPRTTRHTHPHTHNTPHAPLLNAHLNTTPYTLQSNTHQAAAYHFRAWAWHQGPHFTPLRLCVAPLAYPLRTPCVTRRPSCVALAWRPLVAPSCGALTSSRRRTATRRPHRRTVCRTWRGRRSTPAPARRVRKQLVLMICLSVRLQCLHCIRSLPPLHTVTASTT